MYLIVKADKGLLLTLHDGNRNARVKNRKFIVINMKSKCAELLISHVHWFNLTDAVVLHILANNKNRLSFVFQFSTYMTTRIIIVLVQMKDCMDV